MEKNWKIKIQKRILNYWGSIKKVDGRLKCTANGLVNQSNWRERGMWDWIFISLLIGLTTERKNKLS